MGAEVKINNVDVASEMPLAVDGFMTTGSHCQFVTHSSHSTHMSCIIVMSVNILYRLDPFHAPLCNLTFLMMLHSIFYILI